MLERLGTVEPANVNVDLHQRGGADGKFVMVDRRELMDS